MPQQSSSTDSLVRGQRAIPRAEHVGSLIRPAALQAANQEMLTLTGHATSATNELMASKGATEPGADLSAEQELAQLQDQLVSQAVARQLQIGLDVVTDGEYRRMFFAESFDGAVKGFRRSDETMELTGPGGEVRTVPARPVVAERLTRVGNPLAREAAFLKSLTDGRIKVTVPAPSMFCWYGVFTPGVTDRVYSDPDELADHITTLLREIVDGAVAAGANYVQFDYPFYPLFVNEAHRRNFRKYGIDDEQAYLERLLRVDAAVIDGLPSHVRTALHLCRGNSGHFWMSSGSLEPIAERVFALPYDSFLVEWDDKERDGDYSSLRHVPPERVIALGLISTKRTELESEDWVLGEIEQAAQFIDAEQLALAPQCGFGTVAGMDSTSEDLQWRKLDLVARVADQVWPR